MPQSRSRTQKPLNNLIIAGVNLALWPMKAWGLTQEEQDESEYPFPTGYLCTWHVICCLALGLFGLVIGICAIVSGFISLLVVVVGTIVPYLALGISLRYMVGRRCNTINYNYVKANLDLLQ